MAIREINISNIVEIKANKYGDVIKIDTADRSTVERFANLIKQIDSLTEEFTQKEKALHEKYADSEIVKETEDGTEVDVEQIVERSNLYVSSIKDVISEFEIVFGDGCIKKVFRESYELNEDFIPDEDALSEFLDQMMPIMTEIFNERFERNKKRYNTNRRGKGKHNLSKEELIKAQMGKA